MVVVFLLVVMAASIPGNHVAVEVVAFSMLCGYGVWLSLKGGGG